MSSRATIYLLDLEAFEWSLFQDAALTYVSRELARDSSNNAAWLSLRASLQRATSLESLREQLGEDSALVYRCGRWYLRDSLYACGSQDCAGETLSAVLGPHLTEITFVLY